MWNTIYIFRQLFNNTTTTTKNKQKNSLNFPRLKQINRQNSRMNIVLSILSIALYFFRQPIFGAQTLILSSSLNAHDNNLHWINLTTATDNNQKKKRKNNINKEITKINWLASIDHQPIVVCPIFNRQQSMEIFIRNLRVQMFVVLFSAVFDTTNSVVKKTVIADKSDERKTR